MPPSSKTTICPQAVKPAAFGAYIHIGSGFNRAAKLRGRRECA
jgi:hypothetical protein